MPHELDRTGIEAMIAFNKQRYEIHKALAVSAMEGIIQFEAELAILERSLPVVSDLDHT